MESIDVFAPLASLQWVDRNTIHANDYNPNKVSEENLKLLIQSILTNGWTLPIVVRPDGTIIDGFHRWTVSGREPLLSLLGGKVPVVVVDHHGDESADVYGTITHNRARGTHLLEPMKAIVKKLIDEGKTVEEIGKQLGMKPEEIFRLSGFTKDEFLNMMTKGHDTYSKAQVIWWRLTVCPPRISSAVCWMAWAIPRAQTPTPGTKSMMVWKWTAAA